jgi:nucleolar protein 12
MNIDTMDDVDLDALAREADISDVSDEDVFEDDDAAADEDADDSEARADAREHGDASDDNDDNNGEEGKEEDGDEKEGGDDDDSDDDESDDDSSDSSDSDDREPDKFSRRGGKREERDDRTVFVGNVAVPPQNAKLKKLFAAHGGVESLRIRSVARNNPKLPKRVAVMTNDFHKSRSSCNAYVVMDDVAGAQAAVAALNGTVFDDKHLRVDFSANDAIDHSVTVFVGNLKFSVEDEELWTLFKPCGDITGVRVVREPDSGVSKGFAFVTFGDKAAVTSALAMHESKFQQRSIRVFKSSPSAVSGGQKRKLRQKGAFSRVSAKQAQRQARDEEKYAQRGANRQALRAAKGGKGGGGGGGGGGKDTLYNPNWKRAADAHGGGGAVRDPSKKPRHKQRAGGAAPGAGFGGVAAAKGRTPNLSRKRTTASPHAAADAARKVKNKKIVEGWKAPRRAGPGVGATGLNGKKKSAKSYRGKK